MFDAAHSSALANTTARGCRTVRGQVRSMPRAPKKGFKGLPAETRRRVGVCVRRLMRLRGVARPVDVATVYRDAYGERLLPEAIARELERWESVVWLGTGRHWFWIETDDNRAVQRIATALAPLGRADAGTLHHAVVRHPNYAEAPPPSAVLLELCRALPWCTVAGATVRLKPDRNSHALDIKDQVLVDVFREHGPALGLREAERLCLEAGLTRSQVTARLYRSALLCRPARGVYVLAGAGFAPSDVEFARGDHRRRRCTLGRGWTENGEIWCIYRISESMAASGVFPFPSTLAGCAEGDYILNDEHFIRVGGTTVWGLEPSLRAGRFEEGDVLLLRLDPISRDAAVETPAGIRVVDGELHPDTRVGSGS